jgi:hypothetical protein
MTVRSAVALAIALVGTWAVAGPAEALEPGVFIDPGSPAGKEYSVPLSALRGAASGRPGAGGGAQPLFGIGVSPPRASPQAGRVRTRGERSRRSTRAQPTRRNGGAPGSQAPGGTRGPGGEPGSGAPPAESTALEDLTHHGSAAPAVALLVALIVLGGFGLGVLLLAAGRRLR